MKRNALIPYFLIMVFGVCLMVALSFIDNGTETAKEDEAVVKTPEEIAAQYCMGCHGSNLEGSPNGTPALKGVGDRLSAEEIKDVLVNGRQGDIGVMPGGLVPQESLDAMVEWLTQLK